MNATEFFQTLKNAGFSPARAQALDELVQQTIYAQLFTNVRAPDFPDDPEIFIRRTMRDWMYAYHDSLSDLLQAPAETEPQLLLAKPYQDANFTIGEFLDLMKAMQGRLYALIAESIPIVQGNPLPSADTAVREDAYVRD